MEAQIIISQLFKNPKVDQAIRNLCQGSDFDDLKQDVFLALLEKDTPLITDLHKRGVLFFYTLSVIKFTRNANNKKKKIFVDVEEIEDESDNPIEYNNAINELPTINGYPYFLELVKAVANYGSINKAAKEIGIPVSSVRRDILFVRKFIKKQIC